MPAYFFLTRPEVVPWVQALRFSAKPSDFPLE